MNNTQPKLMSLLTSFCLIFLLLACCLQNYYFSEVNSLVITFYSLSYLAGGYFATIKAWEDLKSKNINIEFLMIFAAIGSAIIGQYLEGGILLFLFSLSGTMEKLILGRTRRAIEKLLSLSPESAVVLIDGHEQKIAVSDLKEGDLVMIRPGEKIPGDGIIQEGITTVDQSILTGESQFVDKQVGDKVFAATLNQEGAIKVLITKKSTETVYSRIIQLIEEAQKEKAASENFTKWFGEKYTFIILSISVTTFFIFFSYYNLSSWLSFYKAMTLLVLASPCAVVISIPSAILAAIAAAAKRGILFKGGRHLETLANINALAFDKTGTLTLGQPRVVNILSVDGDDRQLLALAAAAEFLSEHSLGKAIVKEARRLNIEFKKIDSTRAIIGKGLEAKDGEDLILLGKKELFFERSIAITKEIEERYDQLNHEGCTVVIVAKNNKIYGILALSDILRKDSMPAIEKLRQLGIKKQILITGDNKKVADKTARELNLESFADLMPENKLEIINSLKKDNYLVGMIGDGINDAPALAAADLGISLGGIGTDVAIESADIILMGDEMLKLPLAIELARKAKGIIKQNLVFSFSVIAFLLGSFLFADLRLPFAVAGHEGSTVIVILNSLRLLGFFSGKKHKI